MRTYQKSILTPNCNINNLLLPNIILYYHYLTYKFHQKAVKIHVMCHPFQHKKDVSNLHIAGVMDLQITGVHVSCLCI